MVLSTYDIFERATPVLDIPILEYQYSNPGFIASSSCSFSSTVFAEGSRVIDRAVTDTLCRCGRAALTLQQLIQRRRASSSCLTRQPCNKIDLSKQEF
ncbi:hypothetical protein KC19_5G076000 [Ceratodon purpureus]|uniref:Uncharacterized protein n=1 Tax=Ceratodon purpureus TaxID=3225 RepID=A0A8T0I0F5_CERPU|nr:hypothetical protein KC19_5G076000 [Ceratodon purpureus]